jgi:hypothetical protein
MGMESAMPALDQAGAYRTDLLIGAMVQFEHEPIKRPVLTGANAAIQCLIQCTGEKRSLQKDRVFFLKVRPLQKFGVLPS